MFTPISEIAFIFNFWISQPPAIAGLGHSVQAVPGITSTSTGVSSLNANPRMLINKPIIPKTPS